jgi:glycosyltransferase involved in cell wall biosynthesis
MSLAACLIVKNEALVIGRCLASLRELVDAVVIVDTGSTDNTVEVIRGFDFPAPLHLHLRPWKHFAHNRTELLRLAAPVADYLLLLDADQTVEGHVPSLTADAYSLRLRNGRLEWWNMLLVRSALPWRYEGVTHEYLTCDQAGPAVPLESLIVTEHADGGGRPPGTQPRWEWDAQALESELATHPDNPRNVFYLARTYDDLATTRPEDSRAAEWRLKAVKRYLQRAQMEGYADETFYALYRVGVLRLPEGDGLVPLLEAWQRCPHRWEPVHEACRWLNQRGLYQASYSLSKRALASPPNPSGLFVFPDVYDYLLLFEYSISAYWVGQYRESLDACQTLLGKHLPAYLEEAVRRNLVFPQDRLREQASPTQ